MFSEPFSMDQLIDALTKGPGGGCRSQIFNYLAQLNELEDDSPGRIFTEQHGNDPVQVLCIGPYHEAVIELLKLKTSVERHKDIPVWKAIVEEGKVELFKTLSESSKEMWKITSKNLLEFYKLVVQFGEDSELFKEVIEDLQDETGEKFLPWVAQQKKLSHSRFTSTLMKMRQALTEEMSDEKVANVKARIEELRTILPEELFNATEPPVHRINQDDLPTAIDMHKIVRDFGITTPDQLKLLLNGVASVSFTMADEQTNATEPPVHRIQDDFPAAIEMHKTLRDVGITNVDQLKKLLADGSAESPKKE